MPDKKLLPDPPKGILVDIEEKKPVVEDDEMQRERVLEPGLTQYEIWQQEAEEESILAERKRLAREYEQDMEM